MGNGCQPPAIDKNFQVPINGCLVERRHQFLPVRKKLLHPQRSFVLSKDLLDGCSLCGIAFQDLIFHAGSIGPSISYCKYFHNKLDRLHILIQ